MSEKAGARMSEKEEENKFIEEWRKKCPQLLQEIEVCMRLSFAAGYDAGDATGYNQGHDETLARIHEGLGLRAHPITA
jgi:putative component of toxin-antitoxin plasmid stabilization module